MGPQVSVQLVVYTCGKQKQTKQMKETGINLLNLHSSYGLQDPGYLQNLGYLFREVPWLLYEYDVAGHVNASKFFLLSL